MLRQRILVYISQVCTVLLLLHKTGVKLNFMNCIIFTERIEHLPHVVRRIKFELADHTLDTIFATEN